MWVVVGCNYMYVYGSVYKRANTLPMYTLDGVIDVDVDLAHVQFYQIVRLKRILQVSARL